MTKYILFGLREKTSLRTNILGAFWNKRSQPCMSRPTTSATTPDKSSTKSNKKKSAFDVCNKTALIALLKQSWKDEEEATNANL